jgi:hypothetical protein
MEDVFSIAKERLYNNSLLSGGLKWQPEYSILSKSAVLGASDFNSLLFRRVRNPTERLLNSLRGSTRPSDSTNQTTQEWMFVITNPGAVGFDVCRVCRVVNALSLFEVTSYKHSINPIINPNPVSLVTNTWQYLVRNSIVIWEVLWNVRKIMGVAFHNLVKNKIKLKLSSVIRQTYFLSV